MVQLLKSEVDGLLKGRQVRNQTIGPFPEIDLQYFDVAYPTFDLVDCKTGSSPLVNAGNGTVTYVNTNEYTLRFFRYDEYLSAYDESKYSRGIGRCDYLAFDIDGRSDYCLLNELCEGKLQNKKQTGTNELARTLQFLSGSTRLKNELASYKNRLCYLSVKEQLVVSPVGMADAFNNAVSIIPSIYTLADRRISNAGFQAYVSCMIVLDGKPIEAQMMPKRER